MAISDTQRKARIKLQMVKHVLGKLSPEETKKWEAVKGWVWYPFTKEVAEALLKPLSLVAAGRCERCGMTLTDPKSIELGIGPECRKNQSRDKALATAAKLMGRGK